jgi:hypothetical protein
MIDLINKFSTEVQENNGSVTVTYCHESLTGYCEYKIIEVNNASPMVGSLKRFKQRGLILFNTDMGDVIEYIHTHIPLSGEKLQEVNKLIRDHSLHLACRSLTLQKVQTLQP